MEINDIIKNPEAIKQLIDVLQSLLPNDTKKTEDKPNFIKTNIKNKKSIAKHDADNENKFLTMAEKNMHKEDTAIDKLLNKHPPSPRTRKFNTVDVVCRSCGKREQVNPSIINDVSRYKCNSCSRSAS